VKAYYEYISELIYRVLEETPSLALLAVFGTSLPAPRRQILETQYKKVVSIGMNIEHTLISPGGRGAKFAPLGIIPVVGAEEYEKINEKYLVRIDNYSALRAKDIIVDYSVPNITNISESGIFDDFADKMVYIAPILYDQPISSLSAQGRDIECLTTFINTSEPRRRALLLEAGPAITNVSNCFGSEALQKIYLRSKVMINIHQTPYHHTFEELRVLPALCCGIIVICERSPLSDRVPYSDFVVWTDYGSVLEKSREVLAKYDAYYASIFGGNRLQTLLDDMKEKNFDILRNSLCKQ
jgi:hypothetical protein